MGTTQNYAESAEPQRIRVIVAHADADARRAVRDALAAEPDLVVAADALDGVEAVELARFYRPEIVLLDIDLPPRGGVGVIAELEAATVVMSTGHDDLATGLTVLRAGARGFLAEAGELSGLATALRIVVAGGAVVSPRLALHLVEQVRGIADNTGLRPVRSALSNREWEVLDLLCAGKSTREIARELFLTEDTVYGHVKKMLRKLGLNSRAEAVSAAGALRMVAR
jgi:NarL family two-component system response regulator LiaR